MAKRLQEDYLHGIVEHANYAESFVRGIDLAGFRSNVEKLFAVTRALEIIGEAANHLSPQFRKQHPDVPWDDIIGMRNIVVHGYFGVDIDVIWRTAQEDIPVLKQQIQQILDSFVEDE
ncbi:MAG: DUF86 domain-containing protein [Caldilineaceae bacterium]